MIIFLVILMTAISRESLDLDLKYEPYILAQTINSEIAKKQHEKD